MNDDFKLDFIGFGAPKAGTTWTATIFRQHPETCMSRNKELDYFIVKVPLYLRQQLGTADPKADKRDIEWLKGQFSACEPGQIKGEFSPRYIFDPESPRLIHEHNPDVKLLLNLRNPTDALYSLYCQYTTSFALDRTFEEMAHIELARDESEVLRGYKYYDALQRYLKYFPREQIHVTLIEDLKTDSQKAYEELCAFLGINPVPLEVVNRRVNTATKVRSQRVLRAFNRTDVFVGKHAITRKMRNVLNKTIDAERIWKRIKRFNIKNEKYDEMPQNVRELFTEFYTEPNNQLGELLGRDLSHWNDPTPKKKKNNTSK